MARIFIKASTCLFFICLVYNLSAQQTQTEKLLQMLVDRNVVTKAEADSVLKADAIDRTLRDQLLIGADNKLPALKDTAPLPAITKVRDVFSSPYMKIGGFAQPFFQASDQNLNPAAPEPIHNEFRVRQAVIWAEGRIAKNFNYLIGFDFAAVNLDEVYGEWVPADFFNVRFGQYKVPFTIENPSAIIRLESASYTRSVAALAGINGDVIGNKTGRDFGFQLSGNLLKQKNHFLIQYWAGLFQGTGTNIRDNNNVKDFAGTLAIQPMLGLRFAASMYAGQAYYLKQGDLEAANHVRNRWSLGGEYIGRLICARSEWINANDGGIDKEALYGTVMWRFIPDKWETFFKVDYFNTNKSMDTIVTEYTYGVNFYIARLNRIQLNYIYSDYSSKYAQFDASKIVAQLQLFF